MFGIQVRKNLLICLHIIVHIREEAVMQVRQLLSTLSLALLLSLGGIAVADDMAPEPTVNINQADAETLARVLHGVGQARAEAIVRYRESNGGFMTVEELANVSGIGLATVDRNQARIRIQDDD